MTSDDLSRIVEVLIGAPPTTVAVLTATMVEDALDELLRARLKRNDDEAWRLATSEIGPLASLNSKSVMAYCLGAITQTTYENLGVLRRVRNAFAHSRRIMTFDNEHIRQELSKVKFGGKRINASMKSALTSEAGGELAFTILGSTLYGELTKTVSRGYRRKTHYLEKRTRIIEAVLNAVHAGLKIEDLVATRHRVERHKLDK